MGLERGLEREVVEARSRCPSLSEREGWTARSRSIRLADLLIEVENDLGFSVHFQQPGEKRVDPGEVCALLAAIREPRLRGSRRRSPNFAPNSGPQVAEVRTEIASLDTRLSTQIAGVRTESASLETRLIRWMVGTVLATAALTVGILRFLAE